MGHVYDVLQTTKVLREMKRKIDLNPEKTFAGDSTKFYKNLKIVFVFEQVIIAI